MANNVYKTYRRESNREKAEEVNKLSIKTKAMLGLRSFWYHTQK